MRRFVVVICAVCLTASLANAEFLRWSAGQDDDPFAESERMIMDYMDSQVSGVFIMCDAASDKLLLRLALPLEASAYRLPTYKFSEQVKVDDFETHLAFADDVTLANGNIGIDASFEGESARRLLEELVQAREAFYIKISDVTETIRLPVVGSTAAARKMVGFCLTDASVSAPVDVIRPGKPRGVDWHAFKMFRDLGESGGRSPGNKAGALYRIALAESYAASCSRASVNEEAIQRFAEDWSVSRVSGGEDAETLKQLTASEMAYYASGELTEAQICGFAAAAFGPEGEAGLGFLTVEE